MERTYDIFEKVSDGSLLWRTTIEGHEAAISKLRELAANTANELQVLHLPSKTLIASTKSRTA
jgi:hypothetical protein